MSGMAMALVPARAGSRRLPGKNLRLIHGRSLVCWAVEHGLMAENVIRVAVSTEDGEIAAEARNAGASLISRPPELASDDTGMIDVALHAAETLELDDSDLMVVLQPTSPLRLVSDVETCVSKVAQGGYGSAISVTPARVHPYKMLEVRDADALTPFMGIEPFRATEGHPAMAPMALQPNGAVFVVRVGTLRAVRSFYAAPCYGHVMPPERSVDIDYGPDLRLAEVLMEERFG